MHRFRQLMVCVSDSDRDEPLIRYAAMVSQLDTAVQVRFVHVMPEGSYSEQFETERRIEREIADFFRQVPSNVRVRTDILTGCLVDILLSFAAEQAVDLILLGHQPGHPPGRGSLVRRMAMKAPCSVWIVPDDSKPQVSHVLVPIDFSSPSCDSLAVAVRLSERVSGTSVIPLHVYFDDSVLTPDLAGRSLIESLARRYQDFKQSVDAADVPDRVELVESPNVARKIHEVAAERRVDLKVMATRGRSRSASMLLGSITESVTIEARTPLLVVKHFGASMSFLRTLLMHTRHLPNDPHF